MMGFLNDNKDKLVVSDTDGMRKPTQAEIETELAGELTTATKKREMLEKEAYGKASELLSGATTLYSPSEMNQWSEMVAKAKAAQAADDAEPDTGDWSYFEPMTPDNITGQQYGQIVLGKYQALKSYFDDVLKARNEHKTKIIAADDAALDVYDLDLLWPAMPGGE